MKGMSSSPRCFCCKKSWHTIRVKKSKRRIKYPNLHPLPTRECLPSPSLGSSDCLASSPEIRSVWPTRRETCASTRPSASGPTATAMTVTRSKDRRPCSTCDHDSPLSLDLNHPPPGAAMKHGHLGCHTLKTDPSNRLSASREHVEKLMPNSKETIIYTRATTVSNR